MLNFKPTFSLSSFTFIKRLFSSSSLSAINVVSSAYLRLLIFLLAILIPLYASSSPSFLMIYSAYKLNKQGCITGMNLGVKEPRYFIMDLRVPELCSGHSYHLSAYWTVSVCALCSSIICIIFAFRIFLREEKQKILW